jgi:hypothetical protein
VLSDDDQAVPAHRLPTSQSTEDAACVERKRPIEQWFEHTEPDAHAQRIWHGEDESNRPGVPCREHLSLHLGGTQLRLEVHDPTLDFKVNHLVRVAEQHVGCSEIARPDRHLEPRLPVGMEEPNQSGCDAQLAGISQRHGRNREELQRQFISTRCRHLAPGLQRYARLTTFGATHHLLAHAGDRG